MLDTLLVPLQFYPSTLAGLSPNKKNASKSVRRDDISYQLHGQRRPVRLSDLFSPPLELPMTFATHCLMHVLVE
jgi:hypothetical protein